METWVTFNCVTNDNSITHLYVIETGEVFAYNVASEQFVILAEHYVAEIETSLRRRPSQII